MRNLALLVATLTLGATLATQNGNPAETAPLAQARSQSIFVSSGRGLAPALAIPAPQGFVTDTTGRVSAEARQKMTRLIEELKQKTGAEIAVLVVDSTEPLDDFNYAMQVADEWKPGRKGEDTGVVVLLALKDRKLRVVTGYGVEGVLPDGLIGSIEDREMLPALKRGDVDAALWGGVSEIAGRLAASKGVTLSGLPQRQPAAGGAPPAWLILLAIVLLLLMSRYGRRFGAGPIVFGGGGGGFHGGFGGGGGGFGGFGGGGFGGGGAGRSW